jgi:hypothetical protein
MQVTFIGLNDNVFGKSRFLVLTIHDNVKSVLRMDRIIRTTSQIDVVSEGRAQQDGDQQLFWNKTTVKMNMEVGKVVMKSPHQQDETSRLRIVFAEQLVRY